MTESFVHPALFYRDAEDYLSATVPFVVEGLAEGEPVAVAVPPPNLALLRDALATFADRIVFHDMSLVGRNPGRIIPGVLRRFADSHPGRHVRIIGEPMWPSRTDEEYPACAIHEALVNHAFLGRDATILCPFNAYRLSAEVLRDAEAAHPLVVDEHGPRPSEHFGPDGLISRYNRPLNPPPEGAASTTITGTVANARKFTKEHALRAGFDPRRLDDLVLAVTELVTNSVEHGGGTSTLHLWSDDNGYLCQVSDTGYISDPLAGRLPVGPDRPGGRGLLVVNHLADLVRLHTSPNGTTVQLRFAWSQANNELET
ncbi:anti-sigma regulatory factor [Lentzea sp. NBRC 105346]|uniref:sensor histidine kinase n=1 Tax=Lentzea sp. NBRC 105346 TaxID=3032205 RepID=UPI0024A30E77|nr:sensor histidine kinase [Lentzea sp. NBRC 105346]GLZ33398.1 anti-sigma regulatory factor [Lentzea sp. NBRC 105346]